MSNWLKIRCCILLASSLALPALGDPAVVDRPTITTEELTRWWPKLKQKSFHSVARLNVAVVDSGGNLLAFERTDGAFLAGVDLCTGKARSALRFEEPTATIESTIHDGRYALVTAGAVEMQGRILLKRRGEIIGAIGVSGADSSFDIPIAEAAVEDPAQ